MELWHGIMTTIYGAIFTSLLLSFPFSGSAGDYNRGAYRLTIDFSGRNLAEVDFAVH